MLRISLPWMIEVVEALDRLEDVAAESTMTTSWYPIFNANNKIEALFDQSVYGMHLRVSRQKAKELHEHLNAMIGDMSNPDRVLNAGEVWVMNHRREQFKVVFLSELTTLPCFLVTPKENYDVNLLIDNGVGLFPPAIAEKAPEVVLDAMEAGKALAFELGTACGFHVFRVTESILKRYWDFASSGAPRPNLETIGNYASEMEKKKVGDPKIIEALKQLAKLHRNPLIHPEVILSTDEAIDIIGMARSVIGAMLKVLPDVPLTTAVSLPEEAA